jgi:hypothetical protein
MHSLHMRDTKNLFKNPRARKEGDSCALTTCRCTARDRKRRPAFVLPRNANKEGWRPSCHFFLHDMSAIPDTFGHNGFTTHIVDHGALAVPFAHPELALEGGLPVGIHQHAMPVWLAVLQLARFVAYAQGRSGRKSRGCSTGTRPRAPPATLSRTWRRMASAPDFPGPSAFACTVKRQ